jgi:ceramide glucosyltransferase
MAAILGWVFLALGLAGALYMLAGIPAAQRFLRAPPTGAASFPAVTLLKPLHGAEPGLEANLASFCKQDYPGAIQMLIGLQDETDAAIPIVKRLERENPQIEVTLVMDARRTGSNPKVSNLVNMMSQATHDLLVLSDSDIGATPDYLRNVISALQQEGVGAVSCCYVGKPLDNLWSKLSAMGIDYQFLPGVLLSISMGLAAPCLGSTIAIRKTTLAEIGGFEAFRDVLADDYEIGRAVRAHGHRVAFAPFLVSHTCTEISARELIRHELRWARTIRTVEPRGYLGSGITHAVPLAAMGAILTGFSSFALLTLAAVFTVRLFHKQQLDRSFGLARFPIWLLPLRDVLSFAVFVGSYFTRRVDWRGLPYRVDAEGALTHE